jgi:DnaK suppressor protein
MTHSRHIELKAMLEERRRAIEEQVLRKIRALREDGGGDSTRSNPSSEDPAHEDIDFALVQMQAEMSEKIRVALERLAAGDYGICEGCEEEIAQKRLTAMPFATRCRTCQESLEHIRRRGHRTGNGAWLALEDYGSGVPR